MRSVLTYFPSSQKAQEAADILKKQGYETQIDSVHKYPGEGVTTQMNPLTGRFASLANLTLGVDSDFPNQLLAADPSASGMGGAPASEAADDGHWLLTVVVKDDEDAERVNAICQEHGAVM